MSAEDSRKIAALYDAFCTDIPSLSPLRLPGEGNVGTLARILRYMDSNIHVQLVIEDAKLGDPDTLAGLNQIINTDLSRYPDRAKDVTLAKNILAAARKSWAAPASAAVSAPAVEAVNKVDASALYAQLDRLSTTNAQLVDENAALRAQLDAARPTVSNDITVVEPKTTGAHAAQIIDSVENWTNTALDMDTKQRAALTASIKVLELKNGAS